MKVKEVKEVKLIKASLDRISFHQALKELRAKIRKANDFKAQMSIINKKLGADVSTTKELEAYLEKETGFKNLQMAADSLNVKEHYLKTLELAIPSIEDELITIGKNSLLEESPEALEILRDRFTPNVAPEFTKTAQRFLDFKKWYEKLTHQEQRSFVQFNGTSIKVKLDSLTYVHR